MQLPIRRRIIGAFRILSLGLLLPLAAWSDEVTVTVTGLPTAQRENVYAFLSLRARSIAPKLGLRDKLAGAVATQSPWRAPSAAEIMRLHKLAQEEISQALQPFGLYHPTIQAELTEVSSAQWVATYRVEPGPVTTWRDVTVSVSGPTAELPFVTQLRHKSLPKNGNKVRHLKYNQFKSAWLSTFYAQGYLNAKFVQARMLVDADAKRADLQWDIDSGPRFYFGPITIQQTALRESLVARYHTIVPGDVFATDRLIDLQLALNNTNYFSSVRLDIQRESAQDNRIPVTVIAESRKRHRYEAGIGYGTDTGPRFTAGLENRRVNKRGHRYRINGRTSQIESGLQFEYDIPIRDVTQDRWRLYAQAETGDVGDADATAYSLGVAREDGWWKIRRRLFLNLDHSNFQFGDEPSQTATLLYPGVTLSYDVLDNPQFVRRGFSIAATLIGGAEALGSATSFASLRLTARSVLPLSKRMRLLSALDVGIVEAVQFNALPPAQRWFLGGDRSVRGYAYQSISPENSAGDDIGGSYLAGGSVEVDYRVKGPWAVAAFVDAGDVQTEFPSQFKLGVGVGVRYRSPVGMIRVDLAHPLDDPNTSIRFHLSIGPDL